MAEIFVQVYSQKILSHPSPGPLQLMTFLSVCFLSSFPALNDLHLNGNQSQCTMH